LLYVRVVCIITTYIYTDSTSLHDVLYRFCIMDARIYIDSDYLRIYDMITSWIYTDSWRFSSGYVRGVCIITTYIYTDSTSLHDMLDRICIMDATLFILEIS
jgi:hypothetical protein